VQCQDGVMPCGGEGNRRSGVAVAVRLQWFIHMQAPGLRKGLMPLLLHRAWDVAHFTYRANN